MKTTMKVTVLRNDQMTHLVKMCQSGKSAKLHMDKVKGERSCCVRSQLCIVGIVLGFLISQCVIWISYHYRGGQSLYLDVDLPQTPVEIYLENNVLHIRKALMSRSAGNIQNSLLMSAILNIAQDSLRQDIENEGFIVVEPDVKDNTDIPRPDYLLSINDIKGNRNSWSNVLLPKPEYHNFNSDRNLNTNPEQDTAVFERVNFKIKSDQTDSSEDKKFEDLFEDVWSELDQFDKEDQDLQDSNLELDFNEAGTDDIDRILQYEYQQADYIPNMPDTVSKDHKTALQAEQSHENEEKELENSNNDKEIGEDSDLNNFLDNVLTSLNASKES